MGDRVPDVSQREECRKVKEGGMRKIDLIVIHCSATREDRCFTEFDLDVCHRRRGFNGPGYHFYIRKDGRIVSTRPVEKIGAHAKGHNATSIGICYEGGLDARGRPKDTRTEWQVHSMRVLVKTLLKQYPGSRVWPPGSESGLERQWGDRARGMDKAVSVF